MPTNAFSFFEEGFLTINMSGGTTGGKVPLRLTDISLSTSRDIDETLTFDNGYNKIVQPTYFNWSISCSGIVATDTGESEFDASSSGDTRINGTYNGLQLLEAVKAKTTSGYIYMKLSENVYQHGKVIITAFEISAQAGSKMVYSMTLQGSGDLHFDDN